MFLDRIVKEKLEEVIQLKSRQGDFEKQNSPNRLNPVSLKRTEGRNIIAEIKRKSPSKGALRADLDPENLARDYIKGGAKAISVLTDRKHFHGSGEDLRRVAAISREIPVLRKDFIIDEVQICESAYLGADMVLLIVRILSKNKLKELMALSSDLGLTPLVEVHCREELDIALASGAEIVGINNRNLDTFAVDMTISETLLPLIPENKTKVVESGIGQKSDMDKLERIGADAFLIGEALVSAKDPALELKGFLAQ